MLRSLFFRLILFFIAIIIFGISIGYFYYRINLMQPLKPDAVPVIIVKRGDNISIIADELKRRGIINNRWTAILYARFHGKANKIQAGDYLLQNESTIPLLLQDMIDGKVITYNITVIEGITFSDLLNVLAANPKIKHTLKDKSPMQIANRLNISGNPEGWFLPETYQFTRNTTDFALLERMHHDMQIFLDNAWAHRANDLPLKNAYDALILASIIEKETALSSERQKISGVFIRRLRKNMLLQTDPTVIYDADDYHGSLTRKHLKTDTPYNTYIHKGLPPTPIALPGKASIEAALHPDDSQALYFVANGKGGHTFSDTYQEHRRAVDIYRQQEKK